MKKSMIVNLLLGIFLNCLYSILFIELLINDILYNGVYFGEVLGDYVIPLFCMITIVGMIGIFISSIVRRIKKIISWKEFFIECACTVSGIMIGVDLTLIYLVIRIMTLRGPFYF